jgi:outer membrane receptor protein involved in Fe transport
VDANYYDEAYMDMNPERRTLAALSLLGPNDPKIQKIIDETKLKGGFTLDASLGKSIRINYKYFINVNLSVTNILDNKNIQNGGYEQNRFDFTITKNVDKYQPKLFYYYGRTYFLNVSFRI